MAALHGFFKVILQSQLGFLPLPPDAVQLHFPQLHFPNIPYGHLITLWYSDEKQWQVGFGIRGGLLSFTHGWNDVVEGIPILDHYWVTFTHVSANMYDMIVYSPNGCDIRDIHAAAVGVGQNNADGEAEMEDESDDDVVEVDGWVSGEEDDDVILLDEDEGVHEADVGDVEVLNAHDGVNEDVGLLNDGVEVVNEPDVADVEDPDGGHIGPVEAADVEGVQLPVDVNNQPEYTFDDMIIAREKFRFPPTLATLANLHHEMEVELFYEDGDGQTYKVRQEMNMGKPRFNLSGWKGFVKDKGIHIGQELRLRYDSVQNHVLLSNI
ncbi:hypothetical protein SSX86_002816 [Deinandra increscens subsp. villosa]|uniref:TF-B3 domain-containing protein n=1 Tax=Deinandra increscens subsp. villosa TaxID=3103831 RepID=A0AAP0DX61_9ASTR